MLKSALTDSAAVIATAFRLLWRHWPALLTLYLAGYVSHELLVRGAVKTSAVDGVLGLLVLMLAPIATLAAFILMLRVVRPSLPWLSAATGPGEVRGILDNLGSVLIPFLTVYASYGYLKEDMSNYVYLVWEDESFNNVDVFTAPEKVNVAERLPFDTTVVFVVVFGVSLALRWLLSRWDAATRRPWLGLPAAYLEVAWLFFAALAISQFTGSARGWTESRRVVRWLYDIWYDVTGFLGPIAGPLRDTTSWLWNLVIGSANTVIIIPIAWLVVGAVVYGHRVTPEPTPAAALYRRAVDRFTGVPKPVLRLGAEAAGTVGGQFGKLVHGLRILFRAGLVPMLLFCLAFVLADGVRAWLWELERLLIGPQELSVWFPLSRPLSMLNTTVGWVLLACLLAAAIDRVLRVETAIPTQREPAMDAAYPEVVSRA